MLHLFHGFVSDQGESTYLDNGLFGIEVSYSGSQKEGSFYIFPQLDQNQQSFRYYAFDSLQQKEDFISLLKIQGIGGRSAYQIAMLPKVELVEAVESFDFSYFQQIHGIGPKTAKRILVELKQQFSKEDIKKLSGDEQLYQDIISSLKSLWYSSTRVKKLLPEVPVEMKKEQLPTIMKWMIDHL